jgi:hypothetical protein
MFFTSKSPVVGCHELERSMMHGLDYVHGRDPPPNPCSSSCSNPSDVGG